jgi:hypothetical protein
MEISEQFLGSTSLGVPAYYQTVCFQERGSDKQQVPDPEERVLLTV